MGQTLDEVLDEQGVVGIERIRIMLDRQPVFTEWYVNDPEGVFAQGEYWFDNEGRVWTYTYCPITDGIIGSHVIGRLDTAYATVCAIRRAAYAAHAELEA